MRVVRIYLELLPAKSKSALSIYNFFPPNRGVDFYFEFLPAKSIEESISISNNFFPPKYNKVAGRKEHSSIHFCKGRVMVDRKSSGMALSLLDTLLRKRSDDDQEMKILRRGRGVICALLAS